MNDKIKKAYNNIYVTKELENKIYNKTIYKAKNKLVYLSLTTTIICLFMFTIVNADKVKDYLKSWNTSVDMGDGNKISLSENNTYKEIKDNAKREGVMDKEEVESILGFNILSIDNVYKDEMYYSYSLNEDNNTIGRVDIWYPDFLKYSDDKDINMFISILNKNADYSYVLAFLEGLDASGDKELIEEYTSLNLNTKVIIYTNSFNKKRITATFVYDNVFYKLTGKNITIEELKEIITQLH